MSIKVLTLCEAVRKRPGMYVGELGPFAINQLIDAVVSNAIDQFLRVRDRFVSAAAESAIGASLVEPLRAFLAGQREQR